MIKIIEDVEALGRRFHNALDKASAAENPAMNHDALMQGNVTIILACRPCPYVNNVYGSAAVTERLVPPPSRSPN